MTPDNMRPIPAASAPDSLFKQVTHNVTDK
jgi:hypothetical protein